MRKRLFACALVFLSLGGCGVLDVPSRSRLTPARTVLSLETRSLTHPDGVVETIEKRVGESVGAGVSVSGGSIDERHRGDAPTVRIDGMEGSGGGIDRSGNLSGMRGLLSNPMFWLVLIACGVACVSLWFGARRTAMYAFFAAVASSFALLFPGLSLFLLAGVSAVVIGVHFMTERSGLAVWRALGTVTRGVDRLPDTERAAVKDSIGREASGLDRLVIEEAKRKWR